MTDKLHDETSRIIGHNGEEASLFEVQAYVRQGFLLFLHHSRILLKRRSE